MRSTDSDSKRVAACALYEFFYFIRTCVALLAGFDDDLVLYACERSELSLDYYAVIVRIVYDLLRQSDVLFERF